MSSTAKLQICTAPLVDAMRCSKVLRRVTLARLWCNHACVENGCSHNCPRYLNAGVQYTRRVPI
nr:hypothetical protein [Candidatus Sigynarchaeota archaeon]